MNVKRRDVEKRKLQTWRGGTREDFCDSCIWTLISCSFGECENSQMWWNCNRNRECWRHGYKKSVERGYCNGIIFFRVIPWIAHNMRVLMFLTELVNLICENFRLFKKSTWLFDIIEVEHINFIIREYLHSSVASPFFGVLCISAILQDQEK